MKYDALLDEANAEGISINGVNQLGRNFYIIMAVFPSF